MQNHAHLSSICFDTLLLVFFNFETAMCHIYYIAISHSWILSSFTSKMFYVGLLRYLGLNSGRSVSINVNKTRKHFFRTIHGACMFPPGKQFPASVFVFKLQIISYATRQGILTKIRACEHLQEFCEHEQASTYLIFGNNSSKGQVLQALSNWMGPLIPLQGRIQGRWNGWIFTLPPPFFWAPLFLFFLIP